MKKRLPILCFALVSCMVALAPAAGAQDLEEDVEKMVGLVVESWNNGDPEALAELFTEDADLRTEGGEWVTGRDEIKGYFEEWMSSSNGAKEVLVERGRLVSEATAVVDVLSAVVPEGSSFWGEGVERYAIAVSVVQQRDGSWLFSSWRQCHSAR